LKNKKTKKKKTWTTIKETIKWIREYELNLAATHFLRSNKLFVVSSVYLVNNFAAFHAVIFYTSKCFIFKVFSSCRINFTQGKIRYLASKNCNSTFCVTSQVEAFMLLKCSVPTML